MKGLYVLKKTYENSGGENKEIIAKIDSIILTLIDFKDKLIKFKKRMINNMLVFNELCFKGIDIIRLIIINTY